MKDYIKEYGAYTFAQKPLNEVDSLVLCQVVYLKFDGIVPGVREGNRPISFGEIYAEGDRHVIFTDDWFREDNIQLFELMAASKRFGNLRFNYYVNILNLENETQFAAMTILMDDGSVYLAFRGTDESIVGWKEDFNLAFSGPVHSQSLGVEYVERVSGYLAGNFYVGGHSKGGNLAVYAGMYCQERTRDRMIAIYNHDGPGFRPDVCTPELYLPIAYKTFKFIPASSIVGMVMETSAEYETIESKGFGILQHNPYNWRVEEDHFVRAKERSGKKFMDKTMNAWIFSLTEEEIHSFVDTIYDVLVASNATDFIDFRVNLKKSMQGVSEAVKEIDDETKKVIGKVFRSLLETAGEQIFKK